MGCRAAVPGGAHGAEAMSGSRATMPAAQALLSLPELPEQPSLDEAGEDLVGAPEPADARGEHDQCLVARHAVQDHLSRP